MLLRLKMSRGLLALGQNKQMLLQKLHAASPDLARTLKGTVKARTFVWTGALKSAIDAKGSPNGKGARLVSVYAKQGPQLKAWGRVYVAYQEGEPLGLHTYTNPPRQMFYGIQTHDTPLIQSWVDSAAQGWEAEVVGMGDIEEEFGSA